MKAFTSLLAARVVSAPSGASRGLRRSSHGTRGVALVLVLGFLVLMTVLVVAFFSSVTTDLASAKASASGLSARQLAASAVQVMQGTITNATEPRDDTTVAWASQPGMIRTFGDGGKASDKPLNYYKLYSSDKMIVTKGEIASFVPENDLDLAWNTKPSLFTDLNAPITDVNSNTVFPIADPRAAAAATKVEGFSYLAGKVNGVVAADQSNPLLPMPVKWIYVLRDGTMAAPASGDGTTATFSGTQVPTIANPIIGRIAFWTDDESGKVNLNTASEGTYWDTPIANSGYDPTSGATPDYTKPIGDTALASIQGAQHEYQRYPGHPATTCLSTVFGTALGTQSRATLVKAITDAIPRVTDLNGFSSLGGTAAPRNLNLTTDIDRLYASPDEFAFKPTLGGATRDTQKLGANDPAQIIERSRFFLTASSKAPELNLFGLPRVAIWPVWDPTNIGKRTAFDNAILRCATVANSASNVTDRHPMIFLRKDPASPTIDFSIPRNQQVYGYLNTLTGRAIPGFGGNFRLKYGSTDQSQILTEIFDYIRSTNLADQSDGTLNHTYTPSILPGGTNLNVAVGQVVPTQAGGANLGGTSRGFGRIATISELALVLVKIDDRADISIAEGPTSRATTMTVTGDPNVSSIDPSKQTLMEWVLIPKFFSPMAGYAGLGNDFRVRFAVNNLQIGDAPPISKSLGTLPDLFDTGRLPNSGRDSVMGGLMGCAFPVWGTGSQATSMFPTGLCAVTGTNNLNGSSNGGTISVSGTVDAYIYSPNGTGTGGTPIQTLHFEFPASADKVPIPVTTYWSNFSATGPFRTATSTSTAATKTVKFDYNTLNTKHGGGTYGRRFDGSLDHFLSDSSKSGGGKETVRSLVPTGAIANIPISGDMRMIAASSNVPKEAWKLSQKNASGALTITGGTDPTSADFQVSGLRMSPYFPVGSGKQGSLIPLKNALSYNRPPEVPPGIASAQMTTSDSGVPGDWDNGPGIMVDGPYVNKPDEGQSRDASGIDAVDKMAYIGPNENTSSYGAASSIFFSPNRQISSPVMFGSLSVGVDHPWRTLLFRPATLPGYQTTYQHPGGASPTIPDHLLLDLFWMPVVEPYGISEPLATSGKVNLNTQIAPFTYITRTTGLRAVLKSVMITALDPAKITYGKNAFIKGYKDGYGTQTGTSQNTLASTRYPIDLDQTVGQLTTTTPDSTAVFPQFARSVHSAASPNFFVSPTQICDVPLIPAGSTPANLSAFWANGALTGDNSLERPYSMIYPRVTTKSNTFTVHVRAQSLQKAVGGTPATWREFRDQITGEFRGSYTIEKFFDPNEGNTTDKQGTALANSADTTVPQDAAVRGTRWRLVSSKQFGQ